MKFTPLRFATVAALVSLPVASVWAQEHVIRVEVDVVNVFASVRDAKGAFVNHLEKNDFTVSEDGSRQEIQYFSRETDSPLTIGLLVDVSRSQGRLIEAQRRAANQFLSSVLRKQDAAFLMTFGVNVQILQDFTNSRESLRTGLDRIRVDDAPAFSGSALPRGTLLYDAAHRAAAKLASRPGRKVMVLITDGADQGSRMGRQAAIEAAQKADTIIYSIYYADPKFKVIQGGDLLLKSMSEETGGRFFRIRGKQTIDGVFARLQQEMRNQYVLGYTPSHSANDGRFRTLAVSARPKTLQVIARKGYYRRSEAGQPAAADSGE